MLSLTKNTKKGFVALLFLLSVVVSVFSFDSVAFADDKKGETSTTEASGDTDKDKPSDGGNEMGFDIDISLDEEGKIVSTSKTNTEDVGGTIVDKVKEIGVIVMAVIAVLFFIVFAIQCIMLAMHARNPQMKSVSYGALLTTFIAAVLFGAISGILALAFGFLRF